MSLTIPFIDFGGEGEIIHLAHANGFPPKAYQQLVNELTPHYHVIGMEAQPLWPDSEFNKFKSWTEGADDLITFLDQQKLKNVIGIGHSFGAICSLIAANKRPDLFKKLVLIEPVVLPKWFYLLSNLPDFLVKQLNPMIKKTLVRTDTWTSRELVFAHFRNKKVFSLMSDEALWDYVISVTSKRENGAVYLNYSKEWEAQIFMTVTNPWKDLKELSKPFLAIKGETSDTVFPQVWEKWKQINQTGKLIELKNCGHLVPFEKPKELALEILNYLEGSELIKQ